MQRRFREYQDKTQTSTYSLTDYVTLLGYKYDKVLGVYLPNEELVTELDNEAFGVILRLYDCTFRDLVNR